MPLNNQYETRGSIAAQLQLKWKHVADIFNRINVMEKVGRITTMEYCVVRDKFVEIFYEKLQADTFYFFFGGGVSFL